MTLIETLSVFGREEKVDWLNSRNISAFLEEAYHRATVFAEVDLNYILEVFDKISKAWMEPSYPIRQRALEGLCKSSSFSRQIIGQSFRRLSQTCARSNLAKAIEGELGSIDIFSGFSPAGGKHRLIAKPNGVILHLPHNVSFIDSIEGFVSGIITKNVNLCNLFYEDNPVLPLFLESLKDFDEKGLIWKNQALLSWKLGDSSIEEVLFKKKLTLVFQGRKRVLDSLKPRFGSKLKLIEKSPFYSFAVIEGKSLKPSVPYEVIRNLAFDICYFNQRLSTSPQAVYLLDKDFKTSHQLVEALFDEMIQLSYELPVGSLSFDEKTRVRFLREIYRMKQIKAAGRLVCPEDFSFTLLLDYDQEAKISCLNRTVFVKRVSNIDDLVLQLLPLSDSLNTAALYCSTDIRQYCEERLVKAGVKRITSIGKMNKNFYGFPNNGLSPLRELVEWVFSL